MENGEKKKRRGTEREREIETGEGWSILLAWPGKRDGFGDQQDCGVVDEWPVD